jgi:hypothetical protein
LLNRAKVADESEGPVEGVENDAVAAGDFVHARQDPEVADFGKRKAAVILRPSSQRPDSRRARIIAIATFMLVVGK